MLESDTAAKKSNVILGYVMGVESPSGRGAEVLQ